MDQIHEAHEDILKFDSSKSSAGSTSSVNWLMNIYMQVQIIEKSHMQERNNEMKICISPVLYEYTNV